MKIGSPGPGSVLYVLATLAVVALLAFVAIKVANLIRRHLEQRDAELQARRR